MALTIPKMSATHTYAQKPPVMSIPFRTQAVNANAAASATQRTSRRANGFGVGVWRRVVVSMRLLSRRFGYSI
jgi:hypothetical protein